MERSVMIIDDNQDDVLITKRVISRSGQGLRTLVAASGEEGLTVLRNAEETPSLILLDLKMPGMGGVEVLRRIRGDASLRHIPVIVVTHSSLESDREEALKAGADSFLSKAFDIDEFRRDMESLLKKWLPA